MSNQYANRTTRTGEAPVANTTLPYGRVAYMRPNTSDPEYDTDGGSPALGMGSEGKLPDEIRTGQREPLFGGPHQQDVHALRGLDNLARRDDEEPQISTGWRVQSGKPVPGVFPEQVQDILPTRPTGYMGPNTYMFMRPWERPHSTGEHFSLADHRRKYEIYGMKPQGGVGVNTTRLDPKPWDNNLKYNVQRRDPSSPLQGGVVVGGNKSYRLG